MLGGGVDDDVGAELERALQQGGGEDVVDDDEGAGLVGEVGDGAQVDDVEHRVGGGFEQDHGGGTAQGFAPGVEVVAVDELVGDAVAAEELAHDPEAGTEQGAGGHDMVAGAQVGEHGRVDGGHAGGGGAASLRALDRGEAGFEGGDGGVAEAGILVVLGGAGEGRGGLLGVVIDEARGEKEGFGGFAIGGALGAGMDQHRVRPHGRGRLTAGRRLDGHGRPRDRVRADRGSRAAIGAVRCLFERFV